MFILTIEFSVCRMGIGYYQPWCYVKKKSGTGTVLVIYRIRANKAGLLNITDQLKLVPKSVSVAQYLSYYQTQNRFGDKATYIPKRGDVFIKKSNGSSHVGIVTGYNPQTKEYSTIEGNTSDDTVKQLSRPINDTGLSGFGINTP